MDDLLKKMERGLATKGCLQMNMDFFIRACPRALSTLSDDDVFNEKAAVNDLYR
jgi:hypothetical protein